MKGCFLILVLIFSIQAAAINTDSLKNVIKTARHDSLKINAYAGWQKLLSPNEKEEHQEINRKIIGIAKSNLEKKGLSPKEKKYFENKKAKSLSLSGRYFLISGDYPKATENFLEALEIFKRQKDKKEIANCYSNIGVAHIYKGNYPDALKYSLKALKEREEAGDTMSMAASYNNVAYLYMVLHKYDQSMSYNLKALDIYKKLNMEEDVAGVYINLGILFRNKKEYNKALEYYLMALPIKEKGADKVKLGDLYNNISVVYNSLSDFDQSLKYGRMALRMHEEINNTGGISGSLANMASAYYDLKQFSEAKKCLVRSLDIAKQINHKLTLSNVYMSLALVDSAQGDYRNSLHHYKMYILYRDSLFSEENTRKAVEAEMKYEFGKRTTRDSVENAKQKQIDDAYIEKQNVEIRAKKNQQYFFIGGLVMLLVFAGFMYNRFRVTSRQKFIIEQQKEEVESQKHMVDEKQKEIIDSITYAQRLQKAILTPESEIKKSLPESFLFYKPKDIVAGDFYFFETTHDHIFYAAADCTGHGVPGAMVSVICANALSRCVREFEITDPGEILNKTRELVIDTFRKSGDEIRDGMDISLCVWNKNTNALKWAGANSPLWIVRHKGKSAVASKNNPAEHFTVTAWELSKLMVKVYPDDSAYQRCENYHLYEIPGTKQSIGHTEHPEPFLTHHLECQSGDTIYMFTDGYKDQFGGWSGKKIKAAGLKQIFLSLQELSMENQYDDVELIFDEWHAPVSPLINRKYEQVDDVCVIGIKI